MTLTLHPDARSDFNRRGASLLSRLRQGRIGRAPRLFKPNRYVSAIIDGEDIGELSASTVDFAGDMKARYFPEGDHQVGLDGDDYREFEKLIEAIQQTTAFRETVSHGRVADATFRWFRECRRLSTTAPLCDYIIDSCAPDVRDYEVAVPIALLSVEVPFPVGRVEIRPITEEILAGWLQPLIDKGKNDEERREIADALVKRRKKLQGYSAAFISVQAEQLRAEEIALEETGSALSLLRLYDPASFSSRITSACVPLGRESVHTVNAISLCAGSMQYWTSRTARNTVPVWEIDAAQIAHMRTIVMDSLSQTYREPKTEFHRKILDAVFQFSRVSITHERSEKLVILLASLESIFLKNPSEPIQQNLAERLALIVGRALEDRKQIVTTTRAIYTIRSKFVHHGESIDDVALLDKFMNYAWQAMFSVIRNKDAVTTQSAFIEVIDDRKLAWQPQRS